MIVDFHLHPALSAVSEDEFVKEVERSGVDVGVLLAVDVDHEALRDPAFRSRVLERLVNSNVWNLRVLDHVEDLLRAASISNELVAELADRYPGRFIAVGSVNVAKGTKYVERKLREIDELGLKGVKLLPTLQFFDPTERSKELKKIMKYCEREGKLVIFHTGCDPAVWEVPDFSEYANPRKLSAVLREFRSVPVVLAHMGSYSALYPGIWLDEALELGRKYENVWFDIAAVTYLVTREEFIEKIKASVGTNRVLFGSDYPVVRGTGIREMVDEVLNSPYLTEREKRDILGNNAAKLIESLK